MAVANGGGGFGSDLERAEREVDEGFTEADEARERAGLLSKLERSQTQAATARERAMRNEMIADLLIGAGRTLLGFAANPIAGLFTLAREGLTFAGKAGAGRYGSAFSGLGSARAEATGETGAQAQVTGLESGGLPGNLPGGLGADFRGGDNEFMLLAAQLDPHALDVLEQALTPEEAALLRQARGLGFNTGGLV